MKRALLLSLFSICVLSLSFSCTQQETDIPTPKLTFSENSIEDFQSITLLCTVSGNMTAEKLSLEYSKDKNLNEAQKKTFEKQGGSFSVLITDLEIQTTYYYRYTVENKVGSYTDEKIRQFKTLDYIVPIVKTGDVNSVSGTRATLEGSIEFTCGKDVLEKGFYFGKDSKNLEAESTTSNALTLSVDGLEFATTYYYQAYAKTEIGTGKGEIKEFKTCDAVSFNALIVQDITATSVLAKGGIADNGGIEIEKQGFRYSEGSSEEYLFVESTGETAIASLKPTSSYKIWYYAKTFEGEFESGKTEFETKDGVVIITTSSPKNVTTTAALLKGLISSDGGSAITERGFCYGISEMPTVSNTKVKVAGTTGEYQYNLINLPQNKTYYVRAYAINAIDTYYGNQVTFTTLFDSVTFGTTSCSNISASTASLKGTITSNGGSAITKCGFCYSTTTNPTVNDNLIEITGSKTDLVATIKDLKNGTKYYVRAFATNANSTFYSEEVSFSTMSGVATVTTLPITNIKALSATLNGEIVSDGGSTVTERGFCYSTSSNPTTDNNSVKISGTIGTISKELTNLIKNTKYYVRAYASNSYGTHYGSEVSFTTENGAIAFSTVSTSDIKATSAVVSVSINSNGGSQITERGFCYSTEDTPMISDSKIVISSSNDSFNATLTQLVKSTKYYVRAYATNSVGTFYSNQVIITTQSGIASISQLKSTNIAQTAISLICTILSDGGADIIQRGFCYATSQGPTIESDKIVLEGTIGTLAGTITGLSSNQEYHIRAFAKSSFGVAYSEELTILTDAGLVLFDETSVSNIQPQSVMVNSMITSLGGGDTSTLGFCYGTHSNLTTSDTIIIAEVSGEQLWADIKGLTQNTTYFVRPFAINQFGTSYGEEVSFTTTYYSVEFSAIEVATISMKSAVVSCTISTDNNNSIDEMGICISNAPNPTIANNLQKKVSSSKSMSFALSSLEPGVTYYIVPFLTNSVKTFYGQQMSFSTLTHPIGAAPGLFSVSSDGKQVYLAKGNLIYYESTNEWYFAEEQYSYDSDAVKTFCWGGSGYGYSSPIYGYAPYDSPYESSRITSLSGTEYDWGEHCPIVNGGNEAGLWLTLSQKEWKYILTQRTGADNLRRIITINGKNGLMILPDNWVAPDNIDMSLSSFTVAQWKIIESNGAVFLKEEPFVYNDGQRYEGNSVYDTPYWTSSCGQFYSDGVTRYFPQYFTFVSQTDDRGYSTGTYAGRLFHDHLLFESMKGSVKCYVRLAKYVE